MLRTRDYFLLLVIIVFLVVAIGTTAITRNWSQVENTNSEITFATDTPDEYSAVVTDDMETTRTERLFALKEKIQNTTNISAYIQPEPEAPAEEVETVPEEGGPIIQEIRCSGYINTVPEWSASGIKIDVVEGVRLVYRENNSGAQPLGTSSIAIEPSKDILLKLPVRTGSQGATSCVSSPIIGVTIGGSLIKNTDAALYAPFGEDTILGYALDGYPIYGTSEIATDACGGRLVNGQYRYQLSPERDTVVSCFSGLPVNL